MNKGAILFVAATLFASSANANDLDTFIKYHSTGCVLLNLSELGLTLDDELPKSTANRIESECQQRFNNAVLYTKQYDLNKKVDGSTQLGKEFNLAKDNFFTGCSILEARKENYLLSIVKDKNSSEFRQIYTRCLSSMKKGIFAMREIKPLYE